MATKTKTATPTRTERSPAVDPDTTYNPERLCPTQRDGAETFSRP